MNKCRLWRILFTLLAITVNTIAYAQNAIVIYQRDGHVAKFAFSQKPVITYADNNLVLTTTQTSVQYPLYQLKKIDFGVADALDVEEIKVDTKFSFRGDMLYVSGGEPGSLVLIYNLKGMMVGQYRIDDSGQATVPVQGMKNEVYIVKTKSISFKFKK